LTKREENQLLVFERKVLRTICYPKIENAVYIYRRKYNHELDKEFNSPNALNVTNTSRLRYAIWSHDKKTPRPNTKSSIQSQTQCKEKSKKTVIADSLVIGVRDWTHCAPGRQTWRDLIQQVLTRFSKFVLIIFCVWITKNTKIIGKFVS
jgi:hypothetical protein